jgi:hypothetical protein
MYLGHGTESSVILRIIEDFGGKKRMNGYTLHQTIEKVVYRQESIASRGTGYYTPIPSYIWWHLGLDRGEIFPVVDYGKLPNTVGNNAGYSDNWARAIEEHDGVWKLVLDEDDCVVVDPLKIMVTSGLNFGPKYLTRVEAWWGGGGYYDDGYNDDRDLYTEIEVIYAEAARVIDIPLSFEVKTPKTRKITML